MFEGCLCFILLTSDKRSESRSSCDISASATFCSSLRFRFVNASFVRTPQQVNNETTIFVVVYDLCFICLQQVSYTNISATLQ